MKKSVIFWWFIPLVVAMLDVLYLVGMSVDGKWDSSTPDFVRLAAQFSDWLYTDYDWYKIVVMGFVLIAGPILAIIGVKQAINALTGTTSDDSYVRVDKDYLEVKEKDGKITIEQGYDYETTATGSKRTFMFWTYLFWCIPGFIVYCVRCANNN